MESEEQTTQDSARSDTEAKIKEDLVRKEKDEEKITPDNERKMSPEVEEKNTQDKTESRKESESPTSDRRSSDSRPKSSESIGRPKSSGSVNNMAIRPRSRKGKKAIVADCTHSVTFKVTISLAVPTDYMIAGALAMSVEDEDVPDLKELMKRKKRTFEVSRPQTYFHTEFSVLPGINPTATDLVLYGPLFRLFKYPDAARNERTWQEGDLTWVAWSHNLTVDINKDVLLKMFDHTLEMRVWNIKEKLKPTAKNDRLNKPIKLPSNRSGDADNRGVKAKVSRQHKMFNKLQPKKYQELRPLPTQVSFTNIDMAHKKKEVSEPHLEMSQEDTADKKSQKSGQGSPTPKTLMGVPSVTMEDGRNSFSRLGRLAGHEGSPPSPKRESPKSKGSSGKLSRQSGGSPTRAVKSSGSIGSSKGDVLAGKDLTQIRPRRPRKMDAATREATEHAKQYGVCMIPIKMSTLFSGLSNFSVC